VIAADASIGRPGCDWHRPVRLWLASWVAAVVACGWRRRVDAAIGAALETRARVPDLLALGGT
jgi:hypothetical protein